MYELALKMAWLNLRRRARRSLLVIVMIAAGMTSMIAIEGLYDGMTESMILSTIRSDCGEVSVYASQYRLYQRLEYTMQDITALQQSLNRMPEVRHVAVRIIQAGLASTARKSSMARLIGIDADAEERFGRFSSFIREGAIDWGPRMNGCVMGRKIARDLHVKVGHRIIFSSQDSGGDISAVALRVHAIIQTSNPAIDSHAIFIALARSRRFARLPPHAATQVAIRLADYADPERAARRLQILFPQFEASSWQQLYPVLRQMQDMMRIFNAITFAIVMVVVFIGIFGVMLVSFLERTREFAILTALGVRHSMLGIQAVIEAVTLGLSGFAAGSVFSYAVLYYLCHHGLDLSSFAEGLADFGLNAVIRADIKAAYFVRTFLAILAAAVVSVIFPLYRLKRLNLVDMIQSD